MSTVTTIAGQLDAKGLKVAIVATRFNDFIVDRLVGGAQDYLERHGLDTANITLVRIPGVADAYVFGLPDARWGRRPAAGVELTPDAPLISTRTLREARSQRLSKLYVPEQISIVDELPRSGIGKIDRAACEALAIPHPTSPVSPVVTISLGVASCIPSAESSAEFLVAQADAALYRAKKAGRNRVC